MKYTIKSLNDQMIKAKDSGIINWKELFNNERNGAVSDSNTTFEFDDTIPSEITFIHEEWGNVPKCIRYYQTLL